MKNMEIKLYKVFGGKRFRLVGGPFRTRKEAQNFVKTRLSPRSYYYRSIGETNKIWRYRIVCGTNKKWYVYGSLSYRKYKR